MVIIIIINIYLCFLQPQSEVVCGELQTENAVVGSGNGNIFNVIITVECKIGHRYRGQRTVEVRCLESGTWSLAEVKCTRGFNLFIIIIYVNQSEFIWKY